MPGGIAANLIAGGIAEAGKLIRQTGLYVKRMLIMAK